MLPKTAVTPVKRADARRNIEAILDAATISLSRDPDTSMVDIARAAGVGRVTLYAHFPSRLELVDAVVARALGEGHRALDAVDLNGDPRRALFRLIESSWLLIVQLGAIMVAAEAVLPPGRMRELHAEPATRVQELVGRGQVEGVFRTDLPVSWLVGTLHTVMHGAAAEIRAGRLALDGAAAVIAATVLAAYTPPGETVPVADIWRAS